MGFDTIEDYHPNRRPIWHIKREETNIWSKNILSIMAITISFYCCIKLHQYNEIITIIQNTNMLNDISSRNDIALPVSCINASNKPNRELYVMIEKYSASVIFFYRLEYGFRINPKYGSCTCIGGIHIDGHTWFKHGDCHNCTLFYMKNDKNVQFIDAPKIFFNNIITFASGRNGSSVNPSYVSDSVVHCTDNDHCIRWPVKTTEITYANFTIPLPLRHQKERFIIEVYAFGYINV